MIAAKGTVRQNELETGKAALYPRRRTKHSPFRYFKTSPEIIRLAVMLYVRFPLSLRNVEDLLHERGIEISHETALSDKTSLRQPMLFSGLKTKFNRLTVEYID